MTTDPEEHGKATASEERARVCAHLKERAGEIRHKTPSTEEVGEKEHFALEIVAAAYMDAAREIRNGAHHEGER